MTTADQARAAEAFRQRHHAPPLLLLPNAWDAMSARLFAAAGFEAIATTSAGLAWALGYPDGEAAPWSEVVAATARIVRCVPVPVTADLEAGYGASPEAVAASVTAILRTGVVGLNLEDGLPGATPPIRDTADAVARIRAARAAAQAAGVPIVLNARIDLFLKNIGDPARRCADAVARARAYLAAGADCVYPIGLSDPQVIGDFVRAVGAPVNITARAGLPGVTELQALGVARVSTASAPALVAMAAIRELAQTLRTTGRFDALAAPLSHPDAQRLFSTP